MNLSCLLAARLCLGSSSEDGEASRSRMYDWRLGVPALIEMYVFSTRAGCSNFCVEHFHMSDCVVRHYKYLKGMQPSRTMSAKTESRMPGLLHAGSKPKSF